MHKVITTLLFLLLIASLYLGWQQLQPRKTLETSEKEALTQAEATPTEHEVETFTREEVDHAFGTKPDIISYPDKAIDTEEVPSVAIKESISENVPLHTYQIAPNTYFFYGNIAEVDENNRGFNGNAGFVVTDDSVVVIDSLGTPKLGKRMIATIKKITDKPIKHLIVTHNHPDHAYGAIAFREFGGVNVIGHQGTMKYIESDRIEHSVSYRETFIKSDMQGFKPVTPDTLIEGKLYSKQTFKIGGKTFDIYNTGSHHSFGDLLVHQVEDNIVWISDLAFHNRVTFMADGNSEQSIDAQSWLLKTFANAKLMVPGHGSAQTAPFPMVTETQAYMQQVREKVTHAINNDMELQEAVDTIEFDDWENMNMYGLNHKKNIDFVYRELEEELF
ncbi:MAG: MBL fold metallo-hydrolase [Thiotrichaceae bacterium]